MKPRANMPSNNHLLLRHWTMLRLIPRAPKKITASELFSGLAREGFVVTKRTIERDLQSISAMFPLISDERNRPFGWSWTKDAPALQVTSPALRPQVDKHQTTQYVRECLLVVVVKRNDVFRLHFSIDLRKVGGQKEHLKIVFLQDIAEPGAGFQLGRPQQGDALVSARLQINLKTVLLAKLT